jgi:hypothetical protein
MAQEKCLRARSSAAQHLVGYQGHVFTGSRQRYITGMNGGTSHAKHRCGQCEMPEGQCICDKFCCLCQSQLEIRICADGLMYCESCRNACGYKTSDAAY